MNEEKIMANGNVDSAYTHSKSVAMQEVLKGAKVVVIDPEQEYANLAKTLGGEIINLKDTSSSITNIFDLVDKSER